MLFRHCQGKPFEFKLRSYYNNIKYLLEVKIMKEKVLRTLEFDKVLEKLASYALSDQAKEICIQLTPYSHISKISEEQAQTEEACVLINYAGANPMVYFSDIRPQVQLAQKGGTLSPRQLLNIAFSLRAAAKLYRSLIHDRGNTPKLSQIASALTLLPSLEQNISDSIYGEEEMADNASPKLADIRRKIRQANARVKDKLNQMIRSSSFQKYLQEPIVTIRQDRFVIPVKMEYRSNVPGLIHDQSASGATLFIEPMAIVEINNDIKQLLGEEKHEVNRILQAFSEEVASYADALNINIDILIQLDFCFAKAMLSRSMHATSPKINQEGKIKIVRGRHPLIDEQKVVPLDIWVGDDFRALVITGPNTGGKTVTLKTVGLFTLMMQSGLQVPAELGTELSTFEEVFADIGDEQSIEQSLSTFSSHMKNIVEILDTVRQRDLVLFDELGAGTDPTEGAALAQSILSYLLNLKAVCLATTHYSELKAFALSTIGIENGSMEFNIETLSPTYRLSIGIPGKSNAFEISRKLGLSDKIIQEAKNLLSSNNIKFEDVIANAEYHRQIAEKERQIAEEVRQETIKLRDEAEKLRQKTEENKQNATRKAKEEAKHILQQAKREAEAIVRELKSIRKTSGGNSDTNKLLKSLDQQLDAFSEQLPSTSNTEITPESLQIGDRVLILNLNTEADVLSEVDSKGEILLQAGIMKTKSPLHNLKKIPKKQETIKKQAGIVKGLDKSVPLEVDVRGMALDEALIEVDSYLYKAHMTGYKEVYIIHGKGTGVLKQGIAKHLKLQKHVKSYRLGRYGEGEDGVTVVSLG